PDMKRPSCRSFDFLNSTTRGFFISLSIFLHAVQPPMRGFLFGNRELRIDRLSELNQNDAGWR
ncbi:MAG: hypothetical protein IJ337_00650, partial [Clostridia bacterium]|nr:hypothetical protein [Clostridia bacterium]